MSLLDKIRHISVAAARELEEAGFRTDSEIKSLDRTDICELFGGKRNLKLRKDIFKVIHPKRPVDDLVRELKNFIPHERVMAGSSILADYLGILKEMKTQMDSVQNFLSAHISLLEELSNDQPRRRTDRLPDANTWSRFGLGTFFWSTSITRPEKQENDVTSGLDTKNTVHSLSLGNQVTHSSEDLQDLGGSEGRKVEAEAGGNSLVLLPNLKEVKYNVIVSGKTFNAHQQLIDELMNDHQAQSYRFSQSSRDHQVTLLFKPIASRMESDAEAAMSEIHDDKPVILVLMHHNMEPKSVLRSWKDHPKVVLQVHIFFHEMHSGLHTCKENSSAIDAIRKKLLEYSTQMIPEENLKCESEKKEVAAEAGGNSLVLLPNLKEVKYNVIVSGKTFNAHQQLIDELMNDHQAQSYRFSQSSRDHQVTLLFKPIASRMESDAEAAMSEIHDDKPVILVLMHHNMDPKSVLRSWKDHPKVVLQVHIFFHEMHSGLHTCKENSSAIDAIRKKLLEYSTQMIPEENLKCESERRKDAESGDKKQDLYDDKPNHKKSSSKRVCKFF